MNLDLINELASYDFKKRLKTYHAAKLLRKYHKITKVKLTKEEELKKAVDELEEEK